MDVKLYQASLKGDVHLLSQLLNDDSLLARALEKCSAKNNPLHVAARLGHSDFVKEISTREPKFTRELNSHEETPLHLAPAKGHLEVVKQLWQKYPDACYLHDKDGKTPLHRAAMNGRVEVLKALVGADKATAWLLTDQGDPVLHLCAHHNQFAALRVLVVAVDEVEFVKMKDDADNTILHLLAAKNQYKLIKFLLGKYKSDQLDLNGMNVGGSTALDASKENPSGSKHWTTRALLKLHGAGKARKKSVQNEKYERWVSKMKESLMVVATLMASIAFQAALNPPGGVWQDNGYHNSTLYYDPNYPVEQIPHIAGESVISYTLPGNYKAFTICTASGLLASLSLILFLVSGFSFQQEFGTWTLMVITWIAVASLIGTYLVSYLSLTPYEILDAKEFWMAVPGVSLIWLTLMLTVFSIHIYRGFVLPCRHTRFPRCVKSLSSSGYLPC